MSKARYRIESTYNKAGKETVLKLKDVQNNDRNVIMKRVSRQPPQTYTERLKVAQFEIQDKLRDLLNAE